MSALSADVRDAACLLYDAQSRCVPIPPLTQRYPNLTVGQAYAVQRVNLARRLDEGHALRGHKIGLTSAPMQQLLGVSEPDFGYILDAMVLSDGAEVPVSTFCAPRVEPEARSDHSQVSMNLCSLLPLAWAQRAWRLPAR